MEGIEIVVAPLQARGIDASAACLSATERERAARLRNEPDRRRFILARATLRVLLAERLGGSPACVEIQYGRHGKPALAQSDLQFSVSRSEHVAAYAFARGWIVGIDVEAVRAIPEADAIAAQAFPRRELRAYAALEPRARLPGFFRGWTRTEALVKALGDGLSLPPERLDEELEREDGWLLHTFSPVPGFVAALAARRAELPR